MSTKQNLDAKRRSSGSSIRAACLASAFFASVAASTARAEVYTFAFTGQVTQVTDGLGAFGPQADALSSFSGTYTFDTSTPTTVPLPPGANEAIYQHRSPPAGMSLQLGDFAFRSSDEAVDFRVWVRNEFGFSGSDDYGFASLRNEAQGLFGSPALEILDIDWSASTYLADPFDGLSLPIVPPDLAVLGAGQLRIRGECFACSVPNPTFEVLGVFTTLTLASGPKAGDLNGDGRVNAADVAVLVPELGRTDVSESADRPPSDLNGDGRVGLADLMILQANLSPLDLPADFDRRNVAADRLASPAENVPEPTAPVALIATAAWLAARRAVTIQRRRFR